MASGASGRKCGAVGGAIADMSSCTRHATVGIANARRTPPPPPRRSGVSGGAEAAATAVLEAPAKPPPPPPPPPPSGGVSCAWSHSIDDLVISAVAARSSRSQSRASRPSSRASAAGNGCSRAGRASAEPRSPRAAAASSSACLAAATAAAACCAPALAPGVGGGVGAEPGPSAVMAKEARGRPGAGDDGRLGPAPLQGALPDRRSESGVCSGGGGVPRGMLPCVACVACVARAGGGSARPWAVGVDANGVEAEAASEAPPGEPPLEARRGASDDGVALGVDRGSVDGVAGRLPPTEPRLLAAPVAGFRPKAAAIVSAARAFGCLGGLLLLPSSGGGVAAAASSGHSLWMASPIDDISASTRDRSTRQCAACSRSNSAIDTGRGGGGIGGGFSPGPAGGGGGGGRTSSVSFARRNSSTASAQRCDVRCSAWRQRSCVWRMARWPTLRRIRSKRSSLARRTHAAKVLRCRCAPSSGRRTARLCASTRWSHAALRTNSVPPLCCGASCSMPRSESTPYSAGQKRRPSAALGTAGESTSVRGGCGRPPYGATIVLCTSASTPALGASLGGTAGRMTTSRRAALPLAWEAPVNAPGGGGGGGGSCCF